MKDKTARVLAIIALVFMGLFVAALVATLVDFTLFNGSIGYIALGTGIVGIMLFIVLKSDGRGFSITQMNNEIEMEKIKREMEEAQKEADEQAESEAQSDETIAAASETDGSDARPDENADSLE